MNTGAETPSRAKPMAARSARLRGRRAARIPVENPSSSQRTQPPSASDAVTGRRSRMVLSTGSWLRNDQPRLGGQLSTPEAWPAPTRSGPCRKFRYCFHTGRSRPMRWLINARVSGVAPLGTAWAAGSPGSRKNIRNDRIEIANRRTTTQRSLLTMYRSIWRGPPLQGHRRGAVRTAPRQSFALLVTGWSWRGRVQPDVGRVELRRPRRELEALQPGGPEE